MKLKQIFDFPLKFNKREKLPQIGTILDNSIDQWITKQFLEKSIQLIMMFFVISNVNVSIKIYRSLVIKQSFVFSSRQTVFFTDPLGSARLKGG